MSYQRTIPNAIETQIESIAKEEAALAQERALARTKALVAKETPNRDKWAAIAPSPVGRIELTTGLEREVEDSSYYWDDDTKKAYTARNCQEVYDFFKAVVHDDQAKLREIYDRPENKYDPELQRAVTSASGMTGAVTPGFSSMIALLNNRVAKMRSVCRIVKTDSNTVSLPKVSQAPIPEFRAEGVDMSDTTETNLTKLTGTPEKLGAVIKGSRELFEDSPLLLAQVIAQTTAEAIGSVEDYSILHATPTNMTSNWGDHATASADTWVDASETLATIASKIYELPLDAIKGAVIVINPVAAAALTALSASDRQVMLPLDPAPTYLGSQEGGFGYILGLRCLVLPITTVPSNTCYIGDPQSYYIIDRDTMRVEVDRSAFFDTDQWGVHVSRRVDGVMMQATRIRKYPAA